MSKHIKSLQDETKSWCGVALENEFHFKNVDQAILNGLHRSEIIACASCTVEIIKSLERGCHDAK